VTFANNPLVDNDFHRSGAIFRLFDNLEVKNIDETLEISEHLKDLTINGDSKPAEAVLAN
jgi:hypothetical protein